MAALGHLAVFAIAFVKYGFDMVVIYAQTMSEWVFPALMILCFGAALYLCIPLDQRAELFRFQPRKTDTTASSRSSSSRAGSQVGTRTPRTPTPPPQKLLEDYKTPRTGPAFGHVLTKGRLNPKPAFSPFVNEIRTGQPSDPGYQTPAPKARPTNTPSPDYAELAEKAPTNYATLQRMGMLDGQGTPTRKLLDSQRKQKFGVTVNRLGDVRDREGKGVRDDPFVIDGEE